MAWCWFEKQTGGQFKLAVITQFSLAVCPNRGHFVPRKTN